MGVISIIATVLLLMLRPQLLAPQMMLIIQRTRTMRSPNTPTLALLPLPLLLMLCSTLLLGLLAIINRRRVHLIRIIRIRVGEIRRCLLLMMGNVMGMMAV